MLINLLIIDIQHLNALAKVFWLGVLLYYKNSYICNIRSIPLVFVWIFETISQLEEWHSRFPLPVENITYYGFIYRNIIPFASFCNNRMRVNLFGKGKIEPSIHLFFKRVILYVGKNFSCGARLHTFNNTLAVFFLS